MYFAFILVTLGLAFVLVIYAIEILPRLPVAWFLRACLVPVFLLGAGNRSVETWELMASGMTASDPVLFIGRSLQLAILLYGMLRYFREGPSGYRGEERRRGR